ncbi:MAG TPA: hypothetical protein VK659_24370 [Asanoa sp.]|nr:hypothetical protein [Asanoa sp.]
MRDLLLRRGYPGNVRDLRGLALRIIHRHIGDGEITIGDVPERERPPAALPAPADRGLRDWVHRRVERGDTVERIVADVREVARAAALTAATQRPLERLPVGAPAG